MTISTFDGSALPARRTIIGSLVGALVGGALLGLVLGVLNPGGPPTGEVATVAAASTSGAAAARPPASPSAASASPTKTKAKAIKTVIKSPAPVPGQFIQHPEKDATLTLGTLDSIDASNHDHVIVYVRRAKIVVGDEAKQFYANQGQQPRNTAVVPLDNVQPQGLALQQDAAIWGQFLLGDHQNIALRQLQFDQFLQVAFDDLNRNEHPAIWVKRSLGVAGDVIYLAEHVAQ